MANEIPLANGAGIYLDAGSQCFFVYEEVRDLIKETRLANVTMFTNSFMVLESWKSDHLIPQLRGTEVEMAGDIFDAPHLALYGHALPAKLLSGRFKPAAVYIGTSGIEFEDDRVLLGYHAGDLEAEAKMVLFKCPAKARVILVTPQKIGNPGGRVFDILSVDKLDTRAPIYLVTAAPESGEQEGQFRRAQDIFKGKSMREALIRKQMPMHWITLERIAPGIPKAIEHIVVPENEVSERVALSGTQPVSDVTATSS